MEQETKHTLGRWTSGRVSGSPVNVLTAETGKERFLRYEVATRDNAGLLVAIADVKGKEEISAANAKLIAAAPELFLSLEIALATIQQTRIALYNAPDFPCRIPEIKQLELAEDECRAAISKAIHGFSYICSQCLESDVVTPVASFHEHLCDHCRNSNALDREIEDRRAS